MSARTLEDVLAAHQWHHTRDTHCACGFRTPLAQLAVEGYIAHVAAEVRAWLAEALAGEGLRGAVGRRIDAAFYLPGDSEGMSFRAASATADAMALVRAHLTGDAT